MAHLDHNESVLVIGAGVVGLTTAIELQRAGRAVTIMSDPASPATCTMNSGAIWGPFLTQQTGRSSGWSDETFDELQRRANLPDSGVTMTRGRAIDLEATSDTPWWVESFPGSEFDARVTQFREWRLTIPVIDPPTYVRHLTREFGELGGKLIDQRVERISDVRERYGHVVVSAGLGTSGLVRDASLQPSRGQLVVVKNPGITEFTSIRGDGPDLTYIIPQGEFVVLGGTAESGSADTTPDPQTTRDIVSRCAAFEPTVADANVVGIRVGIRPYRETVRVAHRRNTHIVLNYGHGGSGLSMSWGSAREVRRLIERCRLAA